MRLGPRAKLYVAGPVYWQKGIEEIELNCNSLSVLPVLVLPHSSFAALNPSTQLSGIIIFPRSPFLQVLGYYNWYQIQHTRRSAARFAASDPVLGLIRFHGALDCTGIPLYRKLRLKGKLMRCWQQPAGIISASLSPFASPV